MWQGHTDRDDVSDGDMADVGWLTVGESEEMTRVHLLANGVRTRGPICGHHVSLIVWFILLCKIYGGVRGVRPPDLPHLRAPSHDRPTNRPQVLLIMYGCLKLFKVTCLYIGRGVGPGLSPEPMVVFT
jgi:hypothetical protein